MTIDDKIAFLLSTITALEGMSDEDYDNTSYWQYVLDTGGTYFANAISIYGIDPVPRVVAIAFLRGFLLTAYTHAWYDS